VGPQFKLFKIFQLIGDTIFFDIIKFCGVPISAGTGKKTKRYYAVFEFITAEYLAALLKSHTQFHPFVALSVGYADQACRGKYDPTRFQHALISIIQHLHTHGVQHLMLVMPPPHPTYDTMDKWVFYQAIRHIYGYVQTKFSERTSLVGLDPIFFSTRDQNFDIVTFDSGGLAKGLNIDLKGAVYSRMGSSVTHFTRGAISECLDRLTAATNRTRTEGGVDFGVVAEGNASPVDRGSPPGRVLVRPHEKYNKGVTETMGVMEGLLFRLEGWLGAEQVEFMIDTGASVSVVDQSWAEEIRSRSPESISFKQIQGQVKLILAVGNSRSTSKVAIVRFEVKGVLLYFVGLVVKNLSEKVLLGGNFLLSYRANICYDRLEITLRVPSAQKITAPIAKGTSRFRMEIVESESPGLCEIFPENPEKYFSAHSLFSVQPNTSDEESILLNDLKKKLHQSVLDETVTSQQAQTAFEKLSPYIMVFRAELGCYNGGPIELALKITERWTAKKYGYPHVYQAAVERLVEEMVQEGILEESNTQYIHPIVIVPKGDGSIRICVDASALNGVLLDEHHDPPRLEHLLFEESTGGLFSVIDLKNGFLQILLALASSQFLGIQINNRTYVYRRLPFGTKVSSSIFNRILRKVVYQGVSSEHVRVYVDDVKIQTEDFDTHLATLGQVVRNIFESGMTISLPKIELFRAKVKYLGHYLSDGVISKNFKKGEFFKLFEKRYFINGKFAIPKKRAIQQLVGFLNWYARFIPNYAERVAPLMDLLTCPPPIQVNETHENAYRELKELFFRDLELKQPLYKVPFLVCVRVNERCLTGCILQRTDEGGTNVITMVSSRFSCQIERKTREEKLIYATYAVLKRYKDLLLGYRVTLSKQLLVLLQKFREMVDVNGLCAKWYVYINSFNLETEGYDDHQVQRSLTLLEEYGVVVENTDHQPTVDFFKSVPSQDSEGACDGIVDCHCVECATCQGQTADMLEKPSELLLNLFEAIVTHQTSDPFCSRVLEQLKRGEESKFCLIDDRLFKNSKGGTKVLVVPDHAVSDLVLFFHLVYCHPGIEKTTLLIKRQFYIKDAKRRVGAIVGKCTPCKHNKNSNKAITPTRARIQAAVPGEVLSVDIFGPLPLKRGGVVAVFVALDRLSGYVSYQPIRSMKAESFIRAMGHVFEEYDSLGIRIQVVLSDNAKQFRSEAWCRYLHEMSVIPRFTAPYNPSANPVERAMKDLGEKLRLRINNSTTQTNDHTKWFRELKLIQKTLNSIPKRHQYSPNQVLGIEEFDPIPIANVRLEVPDPRAIVQHRISRLEEVVNDYSVKLVRKPSPLGFTYDQEGWVHLFCDGAASGSSPAERGSSFAVWVAQDHRANQARVTVPSLTNNQAEIMGVVRALEIAYAHHLGRVVVHTDSGYIVDLVESGLLTEGNPKFSTYDNREWLKKLVSALQQFGEGQVKLTHVRGHAVDFGNLEVDYWAQKVLQEYRKWQEVLRGDKSQTETIVKYVKTFNDLEFEHECHKDLISGKGFTQFREGDVVAIKDHHISQAYYGLTKKFYQRYDGEFLVVKRLGSNAYLLRNCGNPGQEIVANVRQLRLIRNSLIEDSPAHATPSDT
jgi:ribonuclease HI